MECDKVTHGRITMSYLCPSSQGDTWNFSDVQVIYCYNGGDTWNFSDVDIIHCYNEGVTWNVGQGDTWNFSDADITHH